MHKLSVNACKILKFDIHVEGKENLNPEKNYYFVSNHQSALDPVIYMNILNDLPLSIVAKKETQNIPVVRTCFKNIGGEFLDREDLKQSLKVMMRVAEDLRNQNRSWLIFPEGTRIKDEKMLLNEFHHGTFKPAMKAGVDIVPCVIYGSFRSFMFKLRFKKIPIYVKFLKPISKAEYEGKTTVEIAKLVQEKIQADISFKARQFDHEYNLKNNKHYKYH